MKRPIHLYYYRAMLRRLVISIMLGMVSALIVWLFHQAMLGLEWLLFSRTDGSLVAVAASITGWRRALTPALGDWRQVCCYGHTNVINTVNPVRPLIIWKPLKSVMAD